MFAVQLADAAKLDPQVVEATANWAAPVPDRLAALRVTEPVVVFETVMVCGPLVEPSVMLPKLRAVGAAVTFPVEVPPAPIPDNATCCGLLPALSPKVSEAVRVPLAVGLKSTVAVQLAETARVVPQVFL